MHVVRRRLCTTATRFSAQLLYRPYKPPVTLTFEDEEAIRNEKAKSEPRLHARLEDDLNLLVEVSSPPVLVVCRVANASFSVSSTCNSTSKTSRENRDPRC